MKIVVIGGSGLIGTKVVKKLTEQGHEALAASAVRHHVALSVVGTDRLQDSGYFRAKLAQERLIKTSGIPYTRSTRLGGAARCPDDDVHSDSEVLSGRPNGSDGYSAVTRSTSSSVVTPSSTFRNPASRSVVMPCFFATSLISLAKLLLTTRPRISGDTARTS